LDVATDWLAFVQRGSDLHEQSSALVHEIAMSTSDYAAAARLSGQLSELAADHHDWLLAHPPQSCYATAHALALTAAASLQSMADASKSMYEASLSAATVATWDRARTTWSMNADAATTAVEIARCV
jgi:hypothetical protein